MNTVFKQPSDPTARRIDDLACLPVFFTLKDKPVLVAGGSEAAAWKAELLAATGAVVHVHAPSTTRSDGMLALAGAGRIELHEVPWQEADWTGMALAVGDCDEAEAEVFAAHAHHRSVPVNVIDKPQFCQFQFGSIVNRSPLVIGISTNGAAPILGQAVRRRIEMLLPWTLAAWTQMAESFRSRVSQVLAPGEQRRSFWERLADHAFRARPGEADPEAWIREAKAAPQGSVTLIGAGPGDAEYLTIKAVRALQAADVILFDDLVSDDVLELARREAKRILVGKRGGQQSWKQDDINAMMLSLARQGRRVARLKSGDPLIFGRAGEEIAALQAEGIPVEIVPGISTAFALAARLKISLTHRDHAQSVRFVTGHARNGKLPANLDWHALSDPATTHIYYMAGRTAAEIAQQLIAHGMSPRTPAVVAFDVSRPAESIRRLDVGALATAIDPHQLRSPVIIGVGQAFAEARKEVALAALRSDPACSNRQLRRQANLRP